MPRYLEQPLSVSVPFENEIQLKNVSFRYSKDASLILDNITLSIPKGSRIGFMGSTGSGKSTLLDIIMGLLSPTEGTFIVDQTTINKENQRAWQDHIAHVPQNIYLSDSSIEENIALGIPFEEIDHSRVEEVVRQAQLIDMIENSQDGYKTLVGEQGVRLSGGQRQRISIARALYKKADVLIFDEATSALDSKTENEVMKSIEELGKKLTILIVAHRLTTLEGCDKVVKLDKDNVFHVGSYQDMVNDSN
jgi:ATP-binding cassette subfamily B protein